MWKQNGKIALLGQAKILNKNANAKFQILCDEALPITCDEGKKGEEANVSGETKS